MSMGGTNGLWARVCEGKHERGSVLECGGPPPLFFLRLKFALLMQIVHGHRIPNAGTQNILAPRSHPPAWFERTASSAKVNSIYRFKTESVAAEDDFESNADW
jgi:hypothetical protein